MHQKWWKSRLWVQSARNMLWVQSARNMYDGSLQGFMDYVEVFVLGLATFLLTTLIFPTTSKTNQYHYSQYLVNNNRKIGGNMYDAPSSLCMPFFPSHTMFMLHYFSSYVCNNFCIKSGGNLGDEECHWWHRNWRMEPKHI